MTVVLGYGFRIRSQGLYELQILDASDCCGWVPEDARAHHADGSGGTTVVNGKGLVVSRGSCLFVCYHVCIIVSPCAVRSARLQGPTVVSSVALLP